MGLRVSSAFVRWLGWGGAGVWLSRSAKILVRTLRSVISEAKLNTMTQKDPLVQHIP